MEQPFVKWGLIAAAFGVVFSLLMYIVSPSSMNSMSAGLIPMAVMVYCAVKAPLEERDLIGGFMSWGQAFKQSFLCIAIYFVAQILFSYILTAYIDPSLAEEQMELAMEMQEKIMNMMGTELNDEQIEELRARAQPSLGNSLMGMLWGVLCFGLPIAAIIAIFVQKKNPENDLV
jgi:hypothetical protein